jgi:hypothetical protein
MELLFVVLGGTVLGLSVRQLLPNRETHGVVLIPAIGAGIAAVLWVGLTWIGLPWNGGLIWWITLLATLALVVVIDLEIGRRRVASDAVLHDRLLKNGNGGQVATPGG